MRTSCVTAARLPPWSDGRSPICPCTPYGRHWWLSCSRPRSATVDACSAFDEGVEVPPSPPLPRQRPDQRQGDACSGGLQPQLDPLLQEEQADGHEQRRGDQAAPVQLLALELQPARPRAAARRVDDLVGDLAIALAIELEILAAARVGDLHQR